MSIDFAKLALAGRSAERSMTDGDKMRLLARMRGSVPAPGPSSPSSFERDFSWGDLDYIGAHGSKLPEDILGRSYSGRMPEEAWRALDVPPMFTDTPLRVLSTDFTSVGSIGQVHKSICGVCISGTHDPNGITGVIAGTTCSFDTTTLTSLHLGYAVDWQVTPGLNAAPFNISAVLSGFATMDQKIANVANITRSITFRVGVGKSYVAGGRFYILFAQRVAPSMTKAQSMPCFSSVASVFTLSLPAGIAGSFGAIAFPLAAYTPSLAEVYDILSSAGG